MFLLQHFKNVKRWIKNFSRNRQSFFLWILHKYLKNALLDVNLFFHVIRNANFEDANNQKTLT